LASRKKLKITKIASGWCHLTVVAVSKGEPTPYPARPRPTTPAHAIRSDAEAIEIAQRLAIRFAADAAERDRERQLPLEEIDEFSQSGLWGMTIPKAYGGPEVSCVTLAEVIKIVAAGPIDWSDPAKPFQHC
jgi:hypothetical protein